MSQNWNRDLEATIKQVWKSLWLKQREESVLGGLVSGGFDMPNFSHWLEEDYRIVFTIGTLFF